MSNESPKPPERKRVTWDLTAASQSDNDSGKLSIRRPVPLGWGLNLSKKKSRTSKHTTTKSLGAILFKKKFCCSCNDSNDSDSLENADIDSLCDNSAHEDEIIARLQQAVNELGHRPTSYEIESEVLKWQRLLEIEQQNYLESGRPKFKYKWFRRNQYLMVKKHPLYATNYETHRKLETRLEEFRFGASETTKDAASTLSEIKARHSYIAHAHLNFYEEAVNYGSGYWSDDNHVFIATLALILSVGNFLRFPQFCYAHGGFTFYFTYCLLLASVGQPLLYFEMLLGQFSLDGPAGFARLHPWASGMPYAVGFVCVVFGCSRNVFLSYSMLYSLISLFVSPGECGQWSQEDNTKCFPYDSLENEADLAFLKEERANFSKRVESSNFSTELFFREVILDRHWQQRMHHSTIHWTLIIAYLCVLGIIFLILRNSLTGNIVKKYLWYSLTIPFMVLIILLHQICKRGALKPAVSYFLKIDFDHVYVLSIWGKAFEMVLCTLGIGYGYHWSISGKSRFDYRSAYRNSWLICGYVAFFGLLSSCVIYCELGVLGEIFSGDLSQYHVFFERLGISFVCFSGALLKLGNDSVVCIIIFFLCFTIFGMWSQILVTDLLFRWVDQGYIIKGRPHHHIKKISTSVVCVVVLQFIIIFPHLFKYGAAILANDSIFEGYVAAYGVLLAELFTILHLYGFERFLVDVEIMTKAPLPALFQIQIRYMVVPTISLFMILMTIDVYVDPALYPDRNKIGWLFYIGVLANFGPILIMVFFAQFHWISAFMAPTNKVNPEPFRYTRPRNRAPITEQRFISKLNAPSQTRGHTIRSDIFEVVDEHMKDVFDAQHEVKKKFQGILKFKQCQSMWLLLLLRVLSDMKIKSMRALLRRIMFQQKLSNDKIDIRFLKKCLEQFIDLAFYAAQRRLQQVPKQDMVVELGNELIKMTTFHGQDYESTDDESSSSESSDSSHLSPSSSQELDMKYFQLHRKLIGKLNSSPEELRTLLEIRIRKILNHSIENDLSLLRFLRRARAKTERELALWNINQAMPIDHFVPASISRHGVKVAYTIFHAIVVDGNDHFVLKRLPSSPRPTIIRLSRNFIDSQPGVTLTDKFSHVVTKKMLPKAREIMVSRNLRDWPKEEVHKHLIKVSDRVDDDVYDFLDPLLTCVLVILSESEIRTVKRKYKVYLTPRTRRKRTEKPRIPSVKQRHSEYGMTTYQALTQRELQDAKWRNLLDQPPDIIFHRGVSDDSDDSLENWNSDDVKSSSGSQSSISHQSIKSSLSSRSSSINSDATGTFLYSPGIGKSRFLLENETLQQRDRKILHGIGKSGDPDFNETVEFRVDPTKIKHISARKWKTLHRDSKDVKYTNAEVKLQDAVDTEARRRGDLPLRLSKSVERIEHRGRKFTHRKTMSLESLRRMLDSEVQFIVQTEEDIQVVPEINLKLLNLEEKLANEHQELLYISLGKLLIVDHAAVQFGMGSSHKSMISLAMAMKS